MALSLGEEIPGAKTEWFCGTPQLHRRFPKPAFICLGIQWKISVEAFAWARWLLYRQVQAGAVTRFLPGLQMSNCPEHTTEPRSALLMPRLANTVALRQQPTCTDSRLDELRMDLGASAQHIHGRSNMFSICQTVSMCKCSNSISIQAKPVQRMYVLPAYNKADTGTCYLFAWDWYQLCQWFMKNMNQAKKKVE